MPELNLILLGPPGAGKGTQAERLQEDFPLAYIATGDILRQAVKDGTDLGKEAKEYMDRGDLVPDEVIIGVILDRLAEPDTGDGFLLDGFPRTDAQAEALDEALKKVDRRLTRGAADRRARGRARPAPVRPARLPQTATRTTSSTTRPSTTRLCDVDGEPLDQRDDDREETVRNRLQVYRDQTSPLDRVLRRARPAAPLRRHAQPDRGARPPARDDRHAAHGGELTSRDRRRTASYL